MIKSSNFAPNLTSNNPFVEYQNLCKIHLNLMVAIIWYSLNQCKRFLREKENSHLIGPILSDDDLNFIALMKRTR